MKTTRRTHRRNYNIPGHAHVLTFSCFHRYPFLAADRTRQWLADAIDTARQQCDFSLWAYVFMPEHAHLLIYPRGDMYSIADIRHAIKRPVGMKAVQYIQANAPHWLPKITRRRGNKTERLFWQSGGGYDRNIDQSATLTREIDYIHLNSVRRGLCQTADEWKWSSAGWFLGTTASPLAPDSIPSDWLA
jgi:putative transposase